MFNVKTNSVNKDVPYGMTLRQARDHYVSMWGTFSSRIDDPVIQNYCDKYILRADLAPGGLKAFGGERVIAETDKDTLVYCAPRQGHAPDAIAMLAELYNKKVVFFCPASKQASNHQAALTAYKHVTLKFVKIAAMPVLNSYAKKWAEENDALYLPFGLSGVGTVTAGLVNMARNVSRQLGKDPTEVWCAVSTGTMTRALQIGWPYSTHFGVAVARNMHDGEVGIAKLVSASIPFLKAHPAALKMPVPSTAAYDAKAWDLFNEYGKPGSIFINVGSDAHINRNLSTVDINSIHSQRAWHDLSDLQNNVKKV